MPTGAQVFNLPHKARPPGKFVAGGAACGDYFTASDLDFGHLVEEASIAFH